MLLIARYCTACYNRRVLHTFPYVALFETIDSLYFLDFEDNKSEQTKSEIKQLG